MSLLGVCRVCLTSNPMKDVTQLKSTESEENHTYDQIMLFCLNIQLQVHEDSKGSTKLCTKCFEKILDFHNFKTLALKNASYLRSLDSQIIKNEIFVADGINKENLNSLGHKRDGSCESNDSIEALECEVKEECKQEDNFLNEESVNECESIVYEYVEDTKKLQARKKKPQTREPKRKKKYERKKKKLYPQEPGICPVCGKQVKNLQEHTVTHLPTELRPKYKCGLCEKVYHTASGRRNHIAAIHKNLKKQCHICNSKVIHLKAHIRAVHDPDSRQFSCLLCDKKFLSQSSVTVHIAQNHTEERAYKCVTCDMEFKTSHSLRQHTRRIHQNEKKYQCDHCSKSFFLKERLVTHIRLHTNERPFKCPVCDRRFISSDSLRGHRYTHSSGELQCTECDKTFNKPAYLRAHLLSHTKEKRYQCQYCAAAFHRSDHRKRHEHNSHVKIGKL